MISMSSAMDGKARYRHGSPQGCAGLALWPFCPLCAPPSSTSLTMFLSRRRSILYSGTLSPLGACSM